jgi:hypothetical protein
VRRVKPLSSGEPSHASNPSAALSPSASLRACSGCLSPAAGRDEGRLHAEPNCPLPDNGPASNPHRNRPEGAPKPSSIRPSNRAEPVAKPRSTCSQPRQQHNRPQRQYNGATSKRNGSATGVSPTRGSKQEMRGNPGNPHVDIRGRNLQNASRTGTAVPSACFPVSARRCLRARTPTR